jgi:hypothetical protein
MCAMTDARPPAVFAEAPVVVMLAYQTSSTISAPGFATIMGALLLRCTRHGFAVKWLDFVYQTSLVPACSPFGVQTQMSS